MDEAAEQDVPVENLVFPDEGHEFTESETPFVASGKPRFVSLTERSRRQIDEKLAVLERKHGEFEVVEQQWTVSSEVYDATVERFEAGTVGGAGIWITNDDGEVLLVRHENEETWSDPGGKQEPGETLAETAHREVREESGVNAEITGILEAHVTEWVAENDPSRPTITRLIAIFDGMYQSGIPRPREGEIAEVKWWRNHPDQLLYDALERFPVPAAE